MFLGFRLDKIYSKYSRDVDECRNFWFILLEIIRGVKKNRENKESYF